MFLSKWRKSAKPRFLPTLELLEKREVLDAALRFQTNQITVPEHQPLVTAIVELSEASTQPVEFFCNLISQSATEEVDFQAHRQHFTIPAGATTISVPLAHIINDNEDEPSETLAFELIRLDTLMVLETPLTPGGTPAANPAILTITIADNDGPALSPPSTSGVIAPDQLTSQQERWYAGPVGISLTDGTVAITESLGGVMQNYNGATLTSPVLQLRHFFATTPPATFTTRLSFNNAITETVYSSATLGANQEIRLGMLLETSALPTGRYPYSVEVIAEGGTLQSFSGHLNWVNRFGSVYGAGWSLGGVDEILPQGGGVMLIQGDGTTLWFAQGTTPESYLSPEGEHSTLTKNANGSFTRISHEGLVTQFDSAGRMQSTSDRQGNSTILGRDANGLITTITEPFGQITLLNYAQGLLASVTDPVGRVTQITQMNGNLAAITAPDPDGSGPRLSPTTSFAYDAQRRLTATTDANGNTTQVVYDPFGKALSVTQADGSIIQVCSSQSMALVTGTTASPATPLLASEHRARVTDSRGNLWQTELDGMGMGLAIRSIDPLGNTSAFERNAQGLVTAFIDPLGRMTRFTRDEFGNVLEEILPDGASYTYAYNPFSQLTRITEPDVNLEDNLPGPTTWLTYDLVGNLTQKVLPDDDANPANNPLLSFSHDSHGLLLTATDARGFSTRYLRDTLGRITTITHPDDNSNPADNPQEAFTYDLYGNLSSTTDALGYATLFNHDLLGNLTQIVRPDMNSNPLDNPVESFTHDLLGNQVTQTDALGHTTSTRFDSMNRLESITAPDPDGIGPLPAPTSRFTHDAVGNLTKSVDPLGRETKWGYDEANRMVHQSRGEHWSLEKRYDAAGQLTQVLGPPPDRNNPDNRLVMHKGYNSRGNLILASDSLMRLQEWQFNEWGELIGFT